MNKPTSPAVLDGLYDRLVDERLSAELELLIQANVLALQAEERSAPLAEAFVKILAGILDAAEHTASVRNPSESVKVAQERINRLDLEHRTDCGELAAAVG